MEFVHFLRKLAEVPNSDLSHIFTHFMVDGQRFSRDLEEALDRLPKGATAISDLSRDLEDSAERAWIFASLKYNSSSVRSGHLILAALSIHPLAEKLLQISGEFRKCNADALGDGFAQIVHDSTEQDTAAVAGRKAADGAKSNRDIFICYRRTESQHVAGRLFDHLERAFGEDRVFKDVDSIPVGSRDFEQEIKKELASAKIVLVVMGTDWLTCRDEAGRRRLDDSHDYVRVEIQWALDSKVWIVPLLVDKAEMPSRRDLPKKLARFALCQFQPMRADPDFRGDMVKLVDTCRKHLGMAKA